MSLHSTIRRPLTSPNWKWWWWCVLSISFDAISFIDYNNIFILGQGHRNIGFILFFFFFFFISFLVILHTYFDIQIKVDGKYRGNKKNYIGIFHMVTCFVVCVVVVDFHFRLELNCLHHSLRSNTNLMADTIFDRHFNKTVEIKRPPQHNENKYTHTVRKETYPCRENIHNNACSNYENFYVI